MRVEEMRNSYELWMTIPTQIFFPFLTNYCGYVERRMEHEEKIRRWSPSHVNLSLPIWKMKQFYISHKALCIKAKMCFLISVQQIWKVITMCKYFEKHHKYTCHEINITPPKSLCSDGEHRQENEWPQNNLIIVIKERGLPGKMAE